MTYQGVDLTDLKQSLADLGIENEMYDCELDRKERARMFKCIGKVKYIIMDIDIKEMYYIDDDDSACLSVGNDTVAPLNDNKYVVRKI